MQLRAKGDSVLYLNNPPGITRMDYKIDPDGYIGLPGGPGLGVTINEDFIKEHPMQSENFNLFKEDWHRRQAKK